MNLRIRVLAGFLAAAACAPLLAQAPAQKAPPAKGTPAGKAPARVYYDTYQASHRLRLRRETCMRDEDMVEQYCVKRCQTGYLAVGSGVPRECRSEKPLPEGQLPSGGRVQENPTPAPPRPAKAIPGA